MSTNKEVSNSGTNERGADYTAYKDTSYDYNNPDGSKYQNDGAGHAVYESPGNKSSNGSPYTTEYNYNESTEKRTYK